MPRRSILNTNEMTKLKLIHPIYLDVPMLVSFAAAVRGGIAFASEITEESSLQKEVKGQMKGRFGLSDLFESLFNANMEASAEASGSDANKTQVQESRSHTEASIAILLYDQLSKSSDYLLHPKTHEDFSKVQPGSLVELTGSVEKNAVDAMIDYIEAANILGGMAQKSDEKGKKNSRNDLENIRQALDKDRKEHLFPTSF